MKLADLQEEPVPAPATAARAAVLVVDDNSLVLGTIESLLGDWGYDCVTAPDGLAALGKLTEHRIGLVLTDYQMPNLNGLDLLARVRERHPQLPVVILSSDWTPERLAEALRHGVLAWVEKPVSSARLRELIATALKEDA